MSLNIHVTIYMQGVSVKVAALKTSQTFLGISGFRRDVSMTDV